MSSTTYSKSRKRGSNSNNRNKVRYSISGATGATGATGAQGATSAQGTQGIEGKKAAKPQELVLDGKKFAWKETPFVDKPSGRRYQSGYAYAIISPGGFVGYEEYGEALRRKQQEYAHKTLPESPDIASDSIFSEKSKLLDKPRLDPKEAARKRLARVPAETIDGRWKAKRHAPNQRQREHLEYCSKVLENEWRKVFRRVAYYKDKGDQAKVKATLLYAGNKYLRLTREAYEKWGGDEAFSLVHVGNFNLNEKGAGAFKAYLEKQLGAVSRTTFSAQDALNISVAPIFGGKRQKEDAILDELQPQGPKARSIADELRGPKEAPIMRSDTPGFDTGDAQFSVEAPTIDTTVRKARQFTESPLGLIPISQLHLDPERFQFKIDSKRNKSGYNPDRYRDARFNPDLAGTITVWKDPQDGKIYVVNGHHRYNIAKNSGYEGNLHVKFSPARTAEEAKFHGAIQNIADEKGTGTDVASIIRSGLTLKDIQQAGVTPKSSIVNKGVILSRLSDRLFKELEQGYNLDEDTALIIAETIPEVDDEGNVVNLNEDKQVELYEGYLRKDFENGVIPKKEYVEALAIAFSTAEGTSKGLNLFGEEDISYKKEVEARAKLLQSVLSTLRAEDRTFGRVNKKNTALLAGSAVLDGTLDAVEAKRLKEAAKATIVAIKQKKNFYGPLNDILKDYTQQWVQASSDAQKKAITEAAVRDLKEHVMGDDMKRPEKLFDHLHGAQSDDKENTERPSLLESGEGSADDGLVSKEAPRLPEEPEEEQAGAPDISSDYGAGVPRSEAEEAGSGRGLFSGDDSASDEDGSGKGFGVGAPIVEKGEEETAQEEGEEQGKEWTITPLYTPVAINAKTLRSGNYATASLDRIRGGNDTDFGWVMRYVEHFENPDLQDELNTRWNLPDRERRAINKFLRETGYLDKDGNLTDLGKYYRKSDKLAFEGARSPVTAIATFHFLNNNALARFLSDQLIEHSVVPFSEWKEKLLEQGLSERDVKNSIKGLEKLSNCPGLQLPFEVRGESFVRRQGSIISALYDIAQKRNSLAEVDGDQVFTTLTREMQPDGAFPRYGLDVGTAKRKLNGIQSRYNYLVSTVFTHGNDEFNFKKGVTANGFAKKILEMEAGPLEEEESGAPSEAEEPTGAPQLPQEATEAAEGIETATDAENATEGAYGAPSDVSEKEGAEEGPAPAPVMPGRKEEPSSTTPLLEGTGSLFDLAQEEEEDEGGEQAEEEEPEPEEETKPGEKSPVMPEEEPEEEQEQGSESFKGEYGEEDLDEYEERIYNEVYGDGDDDFASVKKKAKSGESTSKEAEDDKTIPEGFVNAVNKGETGATEGYDFDDSTDDVLGIEEIPLTEEEKKKRAEKEEGKEPIDVTKEPPAWNPPKEYTAIMEGRKQRAAEKKLRKSSPWSSFRMSDYLRSGEKKASAHQAVKSTAKLAGYTDKDGNLTKLGEALAGVADGKDNEALQNDIKGIATYNLIHNNNLVRFLTDQLSNIHAIHFQRLVEKLEQTGMPTEKAQSLIEGLKSFSTTNDFDLPFQYVGGSKGGSFVARPMGSGLAVLLGLANRSDKNLNIRDEVGYSLTDEDDSFDAFGEDSPGVRQDGVLTRYGFRDEEEAARFLDGLVKKYPDLIEGKAYKKKHDFGLEGGKPIKVTDGNYRLKDGVTADHIIDRVLSGVKPQVVEEPKPEPQAEQPADLPLFQGKGAEAKQEPKKEASPTPAPVKGEEKQPKQKPETEPEKASPAPVSTPKAPVPTKKKESQPKAKESPQDLAKRARKSAREPYYIKGLQGGFYSRKRTGSGSLLEKEQTQLEWALRSAAGLNEDEAADVIKTITKGKPDRTVEDAFEYYIDCIEPLINSSHGDEQTDSMVENAQEALEELVDVVMTKHASKAKKSSKGAKQAVTEQSVKLPEPEPKKPAVPEPTEEPVETPVAEPTPEPVEEPQPEEETKPGEKAPVIEQPKEATPAPEPKQAKSIDEYVADFVKERSRTDDPTGPDSAKRSMETSEAIAEEVRNHYGIAGLRQYMKGIGLKPTGRTEKALMEQIRSHMGNAVLARFKSFVKPNSSHLSQLDEAWEAEDKEQGDEPETAPIMPADEGEEEPEEEPDDIVPDAEETIQVNLGEGAPVIDNSNVDTSIPPWEGENQFEKERRQAAKDHNDPRPPLKDPETRKWVLRAAQDEAGFFYPKHWDQRYNTGPDREIDDMLENAIREHRKSYSNEEKSFSESMTAKKELLDLALNKYLDNHGGGVNDVRKDDGVTTDFWYREAVQRGRGKNRYTTTGPTRLIRKNFLIAIQKGLDYLEEETPGFVGNYIKEKTAALNKRDTERQSLADELFATEITTTNYGKPPSEKQLRWAEDVRKRAAGAAHSFIQSADLGQFRTSMRKTDSFTQYLRGDTYRSNTPPALRNAFIDAIENNEQYRRELVKELVPNLGDLSNANTWIRLDQNEGLRDWDTGQYLISKRTSGEARNNFQIVIAGALRNIANNPKYLVEESQKFLQQAPGTIPLKEAYDYIVDEIKKGTKARPPEGQNEEIDKELSDIDSMLFKTAIPLNIANSIKELPQEKFDEVKEKLRGFLETGAAMIAFSRSSKKDDQEHALDLYAPYSHILEELHSLSEEYRKQRGEEVKEEPVKELSAEEQHTKQLLDASQQRDQKIADSDKEVIRQDASSLVQKWVSTRKKWDFDIYEAGKESPVEEITNSAGVLKSNRNAVQTVFNHVNRRRGYVDERKEVDSVLNHPNPRTEDLFADYLNKRKAVHEQARKAPPKELKALEESFVAAAEALFDDYVAREHEYAQKRYEYRRKILQETPEQINTMDEAYEMGKNGPDALHEMRMLAVQGHIPYAKELYKRWRQHIQASQQYGEDDERADKAAEVFKKYNHGASMFDPNYFVQQMKDSLPEASTRADLQQLEKKLREQLIKEGWMTEEDKELPEQYHMVSMINEYPSPEYDEALVGYYNHYRRYLRSITEPAYGKVAASLLKNLEEMREKFADLPRMIKEMRARKAADKQQYQRGPNEAPILVRPKRQKQLRSITDAPIIV